MAKKQHAKKFREKLTKLFGMLGSANANEREAALGKIHQILASRRKTFNDLTELLQTGKGEEAWSDLDDDQDSAEASPAGADAASSPSANVFDLIFDVIGDYLFFEAA